LDDNSTLMAMNKKIYKLTKSVSTVSPAVVDDGRAEGSGAATAKIVFWRLSRPTNCVVLYSTGQSRLLFSFSGLIIIYLLRNGYPERSSPSPSDRPRLRHRYCIFIIINCRYCRRRTMRMWSLLLVRDSRDWREFPVYCSCWCYVLEEVWRTVLYHLCRHDRGVAYLKYIN